MLYVFFFLDPCALHENLNGLPRARPPEKNRMAPEKEETRRQQSVEDHKTNAQKTLNGGYDTFFGRVLAKESYQVGPVVNRTGGVWLKVCYIPTDPSRRILGIGQ
jgi:hypothetical protein